MEESYRIGEAAAVLGVRVETLRRWERDGKLTTTRTAGGQRVVAAAEVARLLSVRRERQGAMSATSARQHFPRGITPIKKGKLVAPPGIPPPPPPRLAPLTPGSGGEPGLPPPVP